MLRPLATAFRRDNLERRMLLGTDCREFSSDLRMCCSSYTALGDQGSHLQGIPEASNHEPLLRGRACASFPRTWLHNLRMYTELTSSLTSSGSARFS